MDIGNSKVQSNVWSNWDYMRAVLKHVHLGAKRDWSMLIDKKEGFANQTNESQTKR